MPNKAQFVEMLAERLDGDRKRAAAALDAVIDTVYAAIARGEKVAITGFGVFERRDRGPRIGRNPATGARVDVPASRVPAFRPGTEFRAIANGARELLEERTARAQAAVNRASAAVREAADAMREAPSRAAAAAKKATKKAPAKKAAKKTTAKKAAKKTTAKKAPAKKATKKSTPAKKSTAKKTAAKKATKRAPAKKATKRAPAKKK